MIHRLEHKPELLAPAGRWEVLEAVVEAGADAVYLGAKQWNMRLHRGDFHFTHEQIAAAVELLHARGRKLYVTVNNLLGDEEVEQVRLFLRFLDESGVDAVIVQDLATLALLNEEGLEIPAHASTMLNVHCPAMARALAELGVTRVITSRDIDIRTAADIASEAGIEVEYFVHGDMCVAQSGQCLMSGVSMGKSANRGECMKPCRWDYELLSLGADGEEVVGKVAVGHLLSIKDLAMLRSLPQLVHAGIVSFKIEGRMRDAAYLSHVVDLYRRAIDDYFTSPSTYFTRVVDLERMHRNRVRDLSALATHGDSPNSGYFDISGQRETIKLSDGHREERLTVETINIASESRISAHTHRQIPALAVCVADAEAARLAVEAGADRIYLAAEVSQLRTQSWRVEDMKAAIAFARTGGAQVTLRTPRITTRREWDETAWLLRQLADEGIDRVLASHYGLMELANEQMPGVEVAADYGFNLLNATSANLLATLGYVEATMSVEAGLSEITSIMNGSEIPMELVAHGPLAGMLIEHCVIALHAGPGRKDVCRAPCQHMSFALRDRTGERRRLVTDQYCRNHYMMATEMCALGRLDELAELGIASLRIEAQFYAAARDVVTVTAIYRRHIDALADGRTELVTGEEFTALLSISLGGLSRGAMDRSVIHSEKTVRMMKRLHAIG